MVEAETLTAGYRLKINVYDNPLAKERGFTEVFTNRLKYIQKVIKAFANFVGLSYRKRERKPQDENNVLRMELYGM